MIEPTGGPGDPYARVEYRKLIAWKRRIEREGPFLERLLGQVPDRSVLDLGCGTGEHVAYFAERGCRAVGLDRSEAMIEAAREHEARGQGRFVLGQAEDAPRLLTEEPPFGLALCLGNVLPHVQTNDDLARFLTAIANVLLPEAILLVQLLNYTRILALGERTLPVNVRDGDGGREIVFLRLMRDEGDGRMLFFPTTLELDPDAEEPIRVRASRRVELRAWTVDDLLPRFAAAGFAAEAHGDMQGGAFARMESTDLVLVARRR